MINKILQILFVTMMIFALSQISKVTKAQEIAIEEPPTETPPDITGFTYTEGWWDINTNPNTQVQTNEGFTLYSNAYYRLYSQVTTDFNVFSGFTWEQCMWNRNQKLLDMSIPQLIAQSGNFDSFNNQTAWYDFPSTWEGGAYQLSAEVSLDSCPLPQPFPAPDPIDLNGGYLGLSLLRYDYSAPPPNGNGFYLFEHMPHPNSLCPTVCGNSIEHFITVFFDYQTPVPNRIRITMAWGLYNPGCNSNFGLITGPASEAICRDRPILE